MSNSNVSKAVQPASLNGIEFDAIISRDRNYEADIPDYPTESGFNVTDSVLRKPYTLSVTAFISDTPVTWKSRFGNTVGRTQRILNQLENLYFSGEVCTFVTSNKVYTNMGLQSLTIPETVDTGYAVEVTFQLKQIRITEAQTTTIPAEYLKSGATAASAGTTTATATSASSKSTVSTTASSSSSSASSSNSSSKKGCSILYGLLMGRK